MYFFQLFIYIHKHTLKVTAVCIAIIWLILFFVPTEVDFMFVRIVHVLQTAIMFMLWTFLYKRKHEAYRLFLLVVLIQLAFILSDNVLTSWHFVEVDNYVIFSWLTCFIFSVLLLQKYAQEAQVKSDKEAKISAQMTQAKKAYDALLVVHEESQELLEVRVQERTLELNIALQELEEVNQELEQKNTLDELTGLYNRRFYDQKLLAEFRRSRRNLTPLSLVVIDIDHFKQVNDNYGHSAGDTCLIILARLIKHTLRRSSDIGCRYGR